VSKYELWIGTVLRDRNAEGNSGGKLHGFPNDPTWQHCCNFAVVSTTIPSVTREISYNEVCAKLRAEFTESIKRRAFIDYLKGVPAWLAKSLDVIPPPGIGVEVTNVGVVPLKRPFLEVHMQQGSDENTIKGIVSLQSLMCTPPDGSEVDVVQRMRYAPSQLNEREALIVARLAKYALQNFWGRTTVGEAFDELVKLKGRLE
jgi:hypothetical protein